MSPIRLTDEQLVAIMNAARPIAHSDRRAFLEAIAEALRDRELGDGVLHRTIATLQRRFLDPPMRSAG